MGGGVLGGLGLGMVVSALVLAAVSLSTPLPERSRTPPPPSPVATEPAVPAAPAVEDAPAAPTPPTAAPEAPAQDSDATPPAAPATEESVSPEAVSPPERPTDAAPEEDARAVTTESAAALAVDSARPATPGPSAADEEPRVTLPRIEANPAPPGPVAPPEDASAVRTPPSAETTPAPTPDVAALPAQPGPVAVPVAPSPQFIASAETATTGATPRRLALPQASDGPATADTASAPQPEAPAAAPDTPRRVTLPQVAPAAPEAEASPAVAPETPEATVADDAAAPSPRRIVMPQVTQGEASEATASETGGNLPQVAPAPSASASASADAAAEPPLDAPLPQGVANALRDNAVAFDLPAEGPLMAVVLIDDPQSPLDPDLLTRFTFPVSFAIDPLRAGAATRAAELRDAGFEVVILGGGLIPEGAAPSDVETALAAARETLPQAVALMDTPDSRIQGDRPVLDAAVEALAESGHGLLAFPRGLNAAEQSALRAEVPAATIFRLLDDEDQRATVITRFLGRAAFAAGQDGAVVVVGRTRPDTVTALFSWALGARSEQVTLAPVSAALLRLAE